jgi:hypothetical protein
MPTERLKRGHHNHRPSGTSPARPNRARKSQPRSPQARTPSRSSIKPAGMAPRFSKSRAISRSCRCRRVRPNSTARKTSGIHATELALEPVFKSFDDIVDHCCFAWNTLIDQLSKIMSNAPAIGRPWDTQCRDYNSAHRQNRSIDCTSTSQVYHRTLTACRLESENSNGWMVR